MKYVGMFAMCLAMGLIGINIYGSFQSLRPANLSPEVLRFGELDLQLTPFEFEQKIVRAPKESDSDFAKRLTLVIANGLAHVEWLDYDPDMFHQRIPVWENYILYLMGRFSGIPEFTRYHYSNPYRGIERGIGVCGDASMILSGLLDEQTINNTIVTIPGHVLVQAQFDDQTLLLDPDFGVVLDQSVEYYKNNIDELIKTYQQQLGRVNDGELMIARNLETQGFKHWQGRSHFITTKYYFETFAYIAKWAIPLCLLAFAVVLFLRNAKR